MSSETDEIVIEDSDESLLDIKEVKLCLHDIRLCYFIVVYSTVK